MKAREYTMADADAARESAARYATALLEIESLNAANEKLRTRGVLNEWVTQMPWQMQSALLAGLRGPDTGYSPNVKGVLRWLRAMVMRNADPERAYMTPSHPMLDRGAFKKELEFSSMHFFFHFLDALEIVAHSGIEGSWFASTWYGIIVEEFCHLRREPFGDFAARLRRGGVEDE